MYKNPNIQNDSIFYNIKTQDESEMSIGRKWKNMNFRGQ